MQISRAQALQAIGDRYHIPQRLIDPKNSAQRTEGRIREFQQRGLLWTLQAGFGRAWLCRSQSSEFSASLDGLQKKVNRMRAALAVFDVPAEQSDQLLGRITKSIVIGDVFIDNCEIAAEVFASARLTGEARAGARAVFLRLFDGPKPLSVLAVVRQMVKIAQAEGRLADVLARYDGVKREAIDTNPADDKIARIILVPADELSSYVDSLAKLDLKVGERTYFPLQTKAAALRLCVGMSVPKILARAEHLVCKFGFTQEAFDANPTILESRESCITPGYAASAFMNAANQLLRQGALRAAQAHIRKASTLVEREGPSFVVSSVKAFALGLDLYLAAQNGQPPAEKIKTLRAAYRACLKYDPGSRSPQEGENCRFLAGLIKLALGKMIIRQYELAAEKYRQALGHVAQDFSQQELTGLTLDQLQEKTASFLEQREALVALKEKALLAGLAAGLRTRLKDEELVSAFILTQLEKGERVTYAQDVYDRLSCGCTAVMAELGKEGKVGADDLKRTYLEHPSTPALAGNLLLYLDSQSPIHFTKLIDSIGRNAARLAAIKVDEESGACGVELLTAISAALKLRFSTGQKIRLQASRQIVPALKDMLKRMAQRRKPSPGYWNRICRFKPRLSSINGDASPKLIEETILRGDLNEAERVLRKLIANRPEVINLLRYVIDLKAARQCLAKQRLEAAERKATTAARQNLRGLMQNTELLEQEAMTLANLARGWIALRNGKIEIAYDAFRSIINSNGFAVLKDLLFRYDATDRSRDANRVILETIRNKLTSSLGLS